MYRIIDVESKKYTTGGDIGTKRNAEWLNELLKKNGLDQLIIELISAEEENKDFSPFTKSSMSEISIEVTKRIKEKNE